MRNLPTELNRRIQLLGGVPETLLIPLYARALAGEYFPELDFKDKHAEQIVSDLNLNPWRFAEDDRASVRGVIIRERWFDNSIVKFFEKYPDGMCINLGAGLDASYLRICERLGRDDILWIDGDLPEVMNIRQQIYQDNDYYSQMKLDLTNSQWLSEIDLSGHQPIMVSLQGVLMYLEKDEVSELLLQINNKLAHERIFEILFDYCAPLMVKGSVKHPSVKKTGAKFKWGLRNLAVIERTMYSMKVKEDIDMLEGSGLSAKIISGLYRLFSGGSMLYGCTRLSNQQRK